MTMGTTGVVAVGSPTQWRGVFQPRDGYPTFLGKKVWAQAIKDGWEQLARDLLNYGSWKSYERKGICAYCGKPTADVIEHSGPLLGWTVPQHIRDMAKHIPTSPEVEREDALAEKNARETGYPDPDLLWHSHAGETLDELQIFSDEAYPNIEWVYLIDAEAHCLRIYRAGNQGYVTVGEPGWGAAEPDWEALETQGEPIH